MIDRNTLGPSMWDGLQWVKAHKGVSPDASGVRASTLAALLERGLIVSHGAGYRTTSALRVDRWKGMGRSAAMGFGVLVFLFAAIASTATNPGAPYRGSSDTTVSTP